jgi:hypothetical protein
VYRGKYELEMEAFSIAIPNENARAEKPRKTNGGKRLRNLRK